jgi:hypothetical protein
MAPLSRKEKGGNKYISHERVAITGLSAESSKLGDVLPNLCYLGDGDVLPRLMKVQKTDPWNEKEWHIIIAGY